MPIYEFAYYQNNHHLTSFIAPVVLHGPFQLQTDESGVSPATQQPRKRNKLFTNLPGPHTLLRKSYW